MDTSELDARIDSFLERKFAKYPDLAAARRNETRTVKYAQTLRFNGHKTQTC